MYLRAKCFIKVIDFLPVAPNPLAQPPTPASVAQMHQHWLMFTSANAKSRPRPRWIA
jgi:hypothetical protein